jgi:DNA-binding response OmpR family regulator
MSMHVAKPPFASDQPPTPSRHRVLLAEDDNEMRALMAMRLRDDGYDLVEVCDGTALFAAITCIQANRSPMPSVIVSDVRMPGLSGLFVLRTVRDRGWTVPIVLITAFGCEETLNEAARYQATMVLHKPFDLRDLSLAVACLLPGNSESGSQLR